MIRAAFDLGSGDFKMEVAEVVNNTIVKEVYSLIIPVNLAFDYAANNGKISPKAQERALKALQELKKQAIAHGAQEFAGVATALFREAPGAASLVKKISQETGIPIKIISQREEGILGFTTVTSIHPEMPNDKIIAWDSGNRSFQMTTKENGEYHVFEGKLGNSNAAKLFIEIVRKMPYTTDNPINPISKNEFEELTQLIQQQVEFPDWLIKKIQDPMTLVAGYGDDGCIFARAAHAIGKTSFTIDELNGAIQDLLNLDNNHPRLKAIFPKEPQTTLTRMIMLYALMGKACINEIGCNYTVGNARGVLLTPLFWH